MAKRREPDRMDELMGRLKADPEFAAKWRKEREERIQRGREQSRLEEAPVVAALQRAGVNVSSVWTLVNRPEPYPEAIPVLLEELQKPHPSRVIGSISRALAVPDARFAWPVFFREYKKWPPEEDKLGAKEGLAIALSATVSSETIDDLISLAMDQSQGPTRIFMLRGIRRSRLPQAKRAIEQLAFDPDLAIEIASWRKRKTKTDH